MQFATLAICNTCNLQHVQFATCAICNTCNLHYVKFAECAIGNTCNLQHIQLLTCVISNTCKANQLDGSAIWISWTDKLDRPAGRISWTDQFSLLEALASSHIKRLTFQFVYFCSFWVRRRPCFLVGWHVIAMVWLYACNIPACILVLSYWYEAIRVWKDQIFGPGKIIQYLQKTLHNAFIYSFRTDNGHLV